jgi:hypothetical protein
VSRRALAFQDKSRGESLVFVALPEMLSGIHHLIAKNSALILEPSTVWHTLCLNCRLDENVYEKIPAPDASLIGRAERGHDGSRGLQSTEAGVLWSCVAERWLNATVLFLRPLLPCGRRGPGRGGLSPSETQGPPSPTLPPLVPRGERERFGEYAKHIPNPRDTILLSLRETWRKSPNFRPGGSPAASAQ